MTAMKLELLFSHAHVVEGLMVDKDQGKDIS